MYEGLVGYAWSEFAKWLENNDPRLLGTVNLFLEQVNTMASDLVQEDFDELPQSRLLTEVMTAWREFLEKLRSNNGELSTFWMS